jgi:multiple sugar transport system ATP-binding protein
MATVTLKNVQLGAEGLNLEFRDREFVVLTGPVGCGNSAILRMIAGLEEVSQGDVHLGERRVNDVPPKDRDVALVAHAFAPYSGMSVYQNLAFGLTRRGFAQTEIKKRVLAVAEILGLQEPLERGPQSLSGEERQLVALARAMVLQPKVFLFDAPFLTLEPDAQRRGRAEIKKLHQRLPATMIYATHDPLEAMALGERTLVLDHGLVQQDGQAQSVYDSPRTLFVAGFVGSPPMNLVQGTLKQDRDALLFSEAGDGTIAIRLSASRFGAAREFSGKPIVLGIRPQDIEIAKSSNGAERSPLSFRALVDRVEPRGAETDLHLQTGAHQLICRSRRWIEQGAGGHRFQFEIDLEKAHLFDPVSGHRIMTES